MGVPFVREWSHCWHCWHCWHIMWERSFPQLSSNRFKDQSRLTISAVSQEPNRGSNVAPIAHSFRLCFKKRSILWAIVMIQITGVLTNTDKTANIQVEVKIPNEAEVGSSVELRCEWQLFGENGLYSVKWYKDDHEFFRYVPDDSPRIQTFMQPGVNIDERWSNEKCIRLRDVGIASSGQYKCEVSTEAPSFATTYRMANLTVIAMPEKEPEITGLSTQYAVGENVTANCSVRPSVPMATLRWLINGKPIAKEKTIQYSKRGNFNSVATSNSLGLRVEFEPRYFGDVVDGSKTVAIKCIAQIGSNFLETEKIVSTIYVNNQRLSAGNVPSKGYGAHLVFHDCFSIVLLLVLEILAT